jgi:hypothetical protein
MTACHNIHALLHWNIVSIDTTEIGMDNCTPLLSNMQVVSRDIPQLDFGMCDMWTYCYYISYIPTQAVL